MQAIQACKHTGIQASNAGKQTYMHVKGDEDKEMERLFNTARPQTALARVCPEVLGHCMWCHVSVRCSVALSPPETHMQASCLKQQSRPIQTTKQGAKTSNSMQNKSLETHRSCHTQGVRKDPWASKQASTSNRLTLRRSPKNRQTLWQRLADPCASKQASKQAHQTS